MTEAITEGRIFVSGESVEPGNYLDLETGAKVRVLERDQLPHNEHVVRTPRIFVRMETADADADSFAMRS